MNQHMCAKFDPSLSSSKHLGKLQHVCPGLQKMTHVCAFTQFFKKIQQTATT